MDRSPPAIGDFAEMWDILCHFGSHHSWERGLPVGVSVRHGVENSTDVRRKSRGLGWGRYGVANAYPGLVHHLIMWSDAVSRTYPCAYWCNMTDGRRVDKQFRNNFGVADH